MSLEAYFARHAQTLVGSLGRLARAPFATLMTVGVIAISLSLPLCLHLLVQNARAATGNWSAALDMSVYLKADATTQRAQALATELRRREGVAAVRVIDKDQALREFRDFSGFGSAVNALTENPLPHALVVTPSIAAATPEATEALKTAIAKMPGVDLVQLDTDWVKRFHAILDLLRRVVLLTGALLALGVTLIIGNTIRLDVENRRAEVEVMKLVGGSDGFARRPFLYTGAWYGLAGGALALGLVAIAARVLAAPVNRLSGLYGSEFALRGLPVKTGLAVLAFATALGWLGSWIAATRHIREIEPS
jgi:cell division transport system permease protein